MLQGSRLAIVVPSFHEAGNLPVLLARVRTAMASSPVPWEIIVVDDDSRDGTEEFVTAVAAQDPRVRLLVRRGERGLAGAILHGWQHTDATLLGVIDADMQHPPELLRELLAAMEAGNDLALGSRYTGRSLWRWNPLRRFISAVSIWLTLPLQRAAIRVRDPLSGCFIVRRRCVEDIPFRPTGFKLLLEIIARGRVRSVAEIPFQFGRRTAGHSKAGVGVARDFLILLARLYLARWRGMPIAAESSSD